MSTVVYTIVLEPAEEGGYNVIVPALPGCFTQGATFEEALAMAQDAIGLWLQLLADDGQPIPLEPPDFAVRVEQVAVAIPHAS
jgi:antitoxin HicB